MSRSGPNRRELRRELSRSQTASRQLTRSSPLSLPSSKAEFLSSIAELPHHQRVERACQLAARYRSSDRPALDRLIASLRDHSIPNVASLLHLEDTAEDGDKEEKTGPAAPLFPPMTQNSKFFDEYFLSLAMDSVLGNVAPFLAEVKSPNRRFHQFAVTEIVRDPTRFSDADLVALTLSAVPAVRQKLIDSMLLHHRPAVLDSLFPAIASTYSSQDAVRFLHGCSSPVVAKALENNEYLLSPLLRWDRLVRFHGPVVLSLMRCGFSSIGRSYTSGHSNEIVKMWNLWNTRFCKWKAWEDFLYRGGHSLALLQLGLEFGYMEDVVRSSFKLMHYDFDKAEEAKSIDAESLRILKDVRDRKTRDNVHVTFPSPLLAFLNHFLQRHPSIMQCYFRSNWYIYMQHIHKQAGTSIPAAVYTKKYNRHDTYGPQQLLQLVRDLFDPFLDEWADSQRSAYIWVHPSVVTQCPSIEKSLNDILFDYIREKRLRPLKHHDQNWRDRATEFLPLMASMHAKFIEKSKAISTRATSAMLDLHSKTVFLELERQLNHATLSDSEIKHLHRSMTELHTRRMEFLEQFIWWGQDKSAAQKALAMASARSGRSNARTFLMEVQQTVLREELNYLPNYHLFQRPSLCFSNAASLHVLFPLLEAQVDRFLPLVLEKFPFSVRSSTGISSSPWDYGEIGQLCEALLEFLQNLLHSLWQYSTDLNTQFQRWNRADLVNELMKLDGAQGRSEAEMKEMQTKMEREMAKSKENIDTLQGMIRRAFGRIWPLVKAFRLPMTDQFLGWLKYLPSDLQLEVFKSYSTSEFVQVLNHDSGLAYLALQRLSKAPSTFLAIQSEISAYMAHSAVSEEDKDKIRSYYCLTAPENWKELTKLADSANSTQRLAAMKMLADSCIRTQNVGFLMKSLQFLAKKIKNESFFNRLHVLNSLFATMNRDDSALRMVTAESAESRDYLYQTTQFMLQPQALPVYLELLQDCLEVQDLDTHLASCQSLSSPITESMASADAVDSTNLREFVNSNDPAAQANPNTVDIEEQRLERSQANAVNMNDFYSKSRFHPLLNYFHRLSIRALREAAALFGSPADPAANVTLDQLHSAASELVDFSMELQWRIAKFRLGEKNAALYWRLDTGSALANARTPLKSAPHYTMFHILNRQDLLPGAENRFIQSIIQGYKSRVEGRNPDWITNSRKAATYFEMLFRIVGKAWYQVDVLRNYAEAALNALKSCSLRDREGLLLISASEPSLRIFQYFFTLYSSKWYEQPILRDYVECLMHSRQAKSVFWKFYKWRMAFPASAKDSVIPVRGSAKPLNRVDRQQRRAAIVDTLLQTSKSAIHLHFVWRFLVRWDQQRLAQFIFAKSPFFGPYYLPPSKRRPLPKVKKALLIASPPVCGRSRRRTAPAPKLLNPRAEFWNGLIASSANCHEEVKEELRVEASFQSEFQSHGRVDFAEYFHLPTYYGLHRLPPRTLELLERQLVEMSRNPDRGVPDRVNALIRFTLLPSVSCLQVIDFIERQDKFRLERWLQWPNQHEADLIREVNDAAMSDSAAEAGKDKQKGKKKDMFPVNLLEALIKGILKDNNPFVPLLYILQPKFLSSQQARVAIFAVASVKPLLVPSSLTRLLKFILSGKRRMAMKITAYKEVIRLAAANNTKANREIILREWGRPDLHRDVKICIIQMAIGFLHGAEGRGVDDAWKILLSAVRSDDSFVLATLLGAKPVTSESSSMGAAKAAGLNFTFSPVGLVEDKKLEPFIESMRKCTVPLAHCEKYAEEVIFKLTYEDIPSDLRHLAIFALSEWIEFPKVHAFAPDLWVRIILESRKEYVVDVRPKVLEIYSNRWNRAVSLLLDASNIHNYRIGTFKALPKHYIDQVLEGFQPLLHNSSQFQRSVRKVLLQRVESFLSNFPSPRVIQDEKFHPLWQLDSGRLLANTFFSQYALFLKPNTLHFTAPQLLASCLDYIFSGIHYILENSHFTSRFIDLCSEISSQCNVSDYSTMGYIGYRLPQLVLIEIIEFLNAHESKWMELNPNNASGADDWKALMAAQKRLQEAAKAEIENVRSFRKNHIDWTGRDKPHLLIRNILEPVQDCEAADWASGDSSIKAALPAPSIASLQGKLNLFVSVASVLVSRLQHRLVPESPHLTRWFIDFQLSFYSCSRIGSEVAPGTPVNDIFLLDLASCLPSSAQSRFIPVYPIGLSKSASQTIISGSVGRTIEFFERMDYCELSGSRLLNESSRLTLQLFYSILADPAVSSYSPLSPQFLKVHFVSHILLQLATQWPRLTLYGTCADPTSPHQIEFERVSTLFSAWIRWGARPDVGHSEATRESVFAAVFGLLHALNVPIKRGDRICEQEFSWQSKKDEWKSLNQFSTPATERIFRELLSNGLDIGAHSTANERTPLENQFLFELAFAVYERFPTAAHAIKFDRFQSGDEPSLGDRFLFEVILYALRRPAEMKSLRSRVFDCLFTVAQFADFERSVALQASGPNSQLERIDPDGGDVQENPLYPPIADLIRSLLQPELLFNPLPTESLFFPEAFAEERPQFCSDFLKSPTLRQFLGLIALELVQYAGTVSRVAVEADSDAQNAAAAKKRRSAAGDSDAMEEDESAKFSPTLWVWRTEFIEFLDQLSAHSDGLVRRSALYYTTTSPMASSGSGSGQSRSLEAVAGSESLSESDQWVLAQVRVAIQRRYVDPWNVSDFNGSSVPALRGGEDANDWGDAGSEEDY